MALFEGTVVIRATPEAVWNEINRASYGQKVAFEKGGRLLAAAELGIAYVYLLLPQPDGTVRLRHFVGQEAQVIQAAQRVRSLPEFLAALEAIPPQESFCQPGEQRLARIKAAAERDPLGQQAAPSPPRIVPRLASSPAKAATSPLPAQVADPYAPSDTSSPMPPPHGKPWNPRTVFSWTFIASYILTGIVLGINWRRLGRPQWVWPTVLTACLGPLALLVAVLLLATHASASALTPILIILVAGLVFNYSFISLIYLLQDGAYKAWQKSGDWATLRDYRYTLGGPALKTAAFVGVGVAVALGVIALENRTLTYENADLRFTYGSAWESLDIDRQDFCRTSDYRCLLVLGRRNADSSLTLISYFLQEPVSAERLEQLAWENLQRNNPGATLRGRSTTGADGYPIAVHAFFIPGYNAGRVCSDLQVIQFYLVIGQTAYEFMFEASCPDTYDRLDDEVYQIISGIEVIAGQPSGPAA